MISKTTRPCIEVLAALLCPAAQENRGNAGQRAACTPEALRLCGSYIPDPTKVEQCLRQNVSGLSRAWAVASSSQ
jgi:hypothetical protein